MSNRILKAFSAVAALAALALGGSAIAGAASSQSTTSTSSTAASSGAAQQRPAFNGPAHGTAAHEDAETAVTGDAADKAKAAAVKSVGGGTAGEVTNDFTKDGYEVTVTKSDGSKVEVHLDKSFTVMDGHGPGGDGPGGPPPAGG